MPNQKKQKMGMYVEVVIHGHGAHEIVAAYDVPFEKAEDLQKLFDDNPSLFTQRNS